MIHGGIWEVFWGIEKKWEREREWDHGILFHLIVCKYQCSQKTNAFLSLLPRLSFRRFPGGLQLTPGAPFQKMEGVYEGLEQEGGGGYNTI